MGYEFLATDLPANIGSQGLDGMFSICLTHAHGFRGTHDQLDFFSSPHIATLRLLLRSE